MRKICIAFLFVTMYGFSAVFGQLKVSNNYGQDLKITINGEENVVPYKGVKTFAVRGQKNVVLECATTDGKNKFSMPKEVSRSGMVTIEPVENRMDHGQSAPVSVGNETPVNQSSSPLAAILQGSGKPAGSNAPAPPVNVNNATGQTIAPPQPQAGSSLVKVIYTGVEKFKVFSDIGGSQWQGIEFRGKNKVDSLQDNSKNEYNLYIQKNRDLHIGVIFNPEDAINVYGEFRKRVNQEDNVIYINEGNIKKMSSDEKKEIKVKFLVKDYKLLFDPKDAVKDGKSLISIGYNQTSRRFLAPVGQFYLKASCTNVVTGMFYPTIYIPVHVISSDNTIEITTEQIKILTSGADLNLKWSNLR